MIFQLQHKIGSSVKNFNVLKMLGSGGMLLTGHLFAAWNPMSKTAHIYCDPCPVQLNSNIVMHTGLTTLPPSCADCLEIWEPQPPGTLRACPDL